MPSRLPRPIEPLIDQRAPRNIQHMWRNIERLRRKRAARSVGPRWRMLAAAVVLLAAGLGLQQWRAPARAGGPLLSAQRSALPSRITPVADYTALDLSDGSRITVGKGARLDVLESSGRSVSLLLREGRARFDIRPRGPRTWRVDCGVLAVEVVGTAFVIQRRGGKVRVEVLRGAVLVRGNAVPDGVARLDVGQSFESAQPAPGPGSRAEPKAPVEPAPGEPEPLLAPSASAPQPPETVELPALATVGVQASRARRSTPRAALQRAGVAKPTPQAQPETLAPAPSESAVEALFREADSARRAGRAEQARGYLETIVAEHAEDPRAALAAFALARLELGQLHSPGRAVHNLRQALSLGLPAALQEDAQAKLVSAHERAGQWTAACAARAEYALRFPRGHQLSEPLQRCRTDSSD